MVLCIDDILDHGKQDRAIYGHEKARNIEFQNPSLMSKIMGRCSHEAFHSLDSEGGSFSYSTGIRVMDEEILENRVEFIDNEMVNDSISEVASKNLSFDGMIDDKSDAFINGISSIHNLLVQLNEIRFVIELEFDGTSGISFVFSAIVVCLEKFGEVHKISR